MDVTLFEHQSYYPKSDIQGENLREYQLWETVQTTELVPVQPIEPLFDPTPQSPNQLPQPTTHEQIESPSLSTPSSSPQTSVSPHPATQELRVYTRRKKPGERTEHSTPLTLIQEPNRAQIPQKYIQVRMLRIMRLLLLKLMTLIFQLP